MSWFRRKPASAPTQVTWKNESKDEMAATLADVACAPEKWRAVCLVAVDSEGGTMIARYRAEGTSGMELLGAMNTATRLLQRAEVRAFEDD
jgi:hypothetical protein